MPVHNISEIQGPAITWLRATALLLSLKATLVTYGMKENREAAANSKGGKRNMPAVFLLGIFYTTLN